MADQDFKDKSKWLADWAHRNAIPEFKKKLFQQVAEDANYEPPSAILRQQVNELIAQARSVDQQLEQARQTKRQQLEQAKPSPTSLPSPPSRLLNLAEFRLKQEKEAEKLKKRALDARQKAFAEINQMQAAFRFPSIRAILLANKLIAAALTAAVMVIKKELGTWRNHRSSAAYSAKASGRQWTRLL
ncbi:MAG: hypothetical protein Q9223_007551 [Gallowayella weberi]